MSVSCELFSDPLVRIGWVDAAGGADLVGEQLARLEIELALRERELSRFVASTRTFVTATGIAYHLGKADSVATGQLGSCGLEAALPVRVDVLVGAAQRSADAHELGLGRHRADARKRALDRQDDRQTTDCELEDDGLFAPDRDATDPVTRVDDDVADGQTHLSARLHYSSSDICRREHQTRRGNGVR